MDPNSNESNSENDNVINICHPSILEKKDKSILYPFDINSQPNQYPKFQSLQTG